MGHHAAVVVFLVLAVLPSLASEPGQPLDTNDWITVAQGVSVSAVIPFPDASVL